MIAFNRFPALREHALAVINPGAFKEQTIVNDIQENLANADTALRNINALNDIQDIKTKTATAQKSISTAAALNEELKQLQKSNTGIVDTTINTVAKALSQLPIGVISNTTAEPPSPNINTVATIPTASGSPQSSQLVCPPVK